MERLPVGPQPRVGRTEQRRFADGSHQDDLVRRPACEGLGQRDQAPDCVVRQTDQHERAGALLDRGDGPARRALERCILLQDRALEILELGPWLDTEVVQEPRARRPVGLEGFGLPAGPVEGQHLEPAKALAERVLLHEPADLPEHAAVVADGQVRLQAALLREQAQLVEPRRDALEEGLAHQVRERRAAPLPEGGASRSAASPGRPAASASSPAAASRSNRRRSSPSGPTRMT